MAFLCELEKFDFRKLQRTQTKQLNWGEIYAQDKDYWSRRGDIQEIIPHFYITSYMGAKNKELLLKSNITHILVAASHLEQKFPEAFTYKQVHILDLPEEPICLHFQEVFEWIQSAIDSKGNVLVHCNAGISRSATFAIGYLMHRQKISYHEAFNLVKSKRSCVSPNRGFVNQLKKLEREYSINYQPPPTHILRSISSPDPEIATISSIMITPPPISDIVLVAPESHAPLSISSSLSNETEELVSFDPDIPIAPLLTTTTITPEFQPGKHFVSLPSISSLEEEFSPLPPLTPLSPTETSEVMTTDDPLVKSVKMNTPKRDSIIYNSPFSCSWEGACDNMKESSDNNSNNNSNDNLYLFPEENNNLTTTTNLKIPIFMNEQNKEKHRIAVTKDENEEEILQHFSQLNLQETDISKHEQQEKEGNQALVLNNFHLNDDDSDFSSKKSSPTTSNRTVFTVC